MQAEEIAALWQQRLEDAKLRLDFATNFLKEIENDQRPGTIPATDLVVLIKPLVSQCCSCVLHYGRTKAVEIYSAPAFFLPMNTPTTVAGFDDIEVGTKLAAYRNEQHEFVLTPALFVTAPTGSQKLGDRHTAVQPALLFAKGFGDFHVGWLRPVAFQAESSLVTEIWTLD